MILACSHTVLATTDVSRIARFFAEAFGLTPVFENKEFAEFVLASRFRIAFFRPTGPTVHAFDATASRAGGSLGLTVRDVDALYERVIGLKSSFDCSVSGPPKDHPWGERSFLLTDPDGNRWEIAHAPSDDGMLVPR